MTLMELFVGAIVALPFELLAHAAWDRIKRYRKESAIRTKYAFLARKYTNSRNGITPTGGSIELTQQDDGTFRTVGYNPDGSPQWEGVLRMSPDEDDVGTASYQYVLRTDHGTQRVVYVRYRDALHVIGMNQSTLEHTEFVHIWEPHIHVGKTLS
jgi:hypothetical protein